MSSPIWVNEWFLRTLFFRFPNQQTDFIRHWFLFRLNLVLVSPTTLIIPAWKANNIWMTAVSGVCVCVRASLMNYEINHFKNEDTDSFTPIMTHNGYPKLFIILVRISVSSNSFASNMLSSCCWVGTFHIVLNDRSHILSFSVFFFSFIFITVSSVIFAQAHRIFQCFECVAARANELS